MKGLELLGWVHAPALALGEDGTILAVNGAGRSLVGGAAEELLNRRCSDVVHQRLGDAGTCDPASCVSSGSADDVAAFAGCCLPQAVNVALSPLVTAVTVPCAEREDGVAAVLVLQQETAPPGEPDPSSSATTGARLGLRLLGAVEVVCDGRSVPVPRGRARELLTLLALAGPTGLPRGEICEILWPSAARGAGRGHLRVLLHVIRHLVTEDLLDEVGGSPGVDARLRLRPDVWTDALVIDATRSRDDREQHHPTCAPTRASELRQTILLYRGDLDPNGEFGGWVVTHRERLRRRFLALVSELIPLAASVGDFETALDACRRAIAVAPEDERFRLSLIALYGQLGQTDEARAEYEEYERALADDDEAPRSRRRGASSAPHQQRRRDASNRR